MTKQEFLNTASAALSSATAKNMLNDIYDRVKKFPVVE